MAYRRDSLKNAEALKQAQVKVLQYFKLGTEKKLTDSTPSKIWLSKKAKLMGLTLKEENLKNLKEVVLNSLQTQEDLETVFRSHFL